MAYLFGSEARGESGPRSDLDVAVLRQEPVGQRLEDLPLELESELEKHLGRPVQVVLLNRAPVDLVHRVLRDGRLLFDRDPSVRIAFEVRARNLYFDLKPHLDRYRRSTR